MNIATVYQKFCNIITITLIAFGLVAIQPEVAFATNKGQVKERVKKAKKRLVAQAAGKKKRKKRRNKRKKRKQKQQNTQNADQETKKMDIVHHEHEGEKDEPYYLELSLFSDFVRSEASTKLEGSDEEAKTGYGQYSLAFEALYLTSPTFEIGGGIDYWEQSSKAGGETSTSREYTLNLKAKMNFGNIDEDLTVFYGYLGAGFGAGTTPVENSDEEAKTSIMRYGLGFGAHYFVDSNVALSGEMGLNIGSRKQDGSETTTQDLHLLRLGLTLFL